MSHEKRVNTDSLNSSEEYNGGPVRGNMSPFSCAVKRCFDCLAAFVLMVIFSPLFLVCYIAVRREDGGPAIFRQERIGRFGLTRKSPVLHSATEEVMGIPALPGRDGFCVPIT